MTYKGYEVEELKEMNHEELADIMNARARRKLQRGLRDQEKKLLEDLEEKGQAQTHLRGMIVLPEMVGTTVEVYNGQGFVPVEIEEEMIGHHLGEFAKTRKEVSHSAPGLGATRSSKHVPLK
jgi:small subunit ribosomal protein S19